MIRVANISRFMRLLCTYPQRIIKVGVRNHSLYIRRVVLVGVRVFYAIYRELVGRHRRTYINSRLTAGGQRALPRLSVFHDA